MQGRLGTTLLWLFVINLGIAFGAGLYEHRIVVGRWLTSAGESGAHWRADAARLDDTGRRFWAFVTTVPLTLLTFASLLAAWPGHGGFRIWWLASALATLGDRVLTFAYFIPTIDPFRHGAFHLYRENHFDGAWLAAMAFGPGVFLRLYLHRGGRSGAYQRVCTAGSHALGVAAGYVHPAGVDTRRGGRTQRLRLERVRRVVGVDGRRLGGGGLLPRHALARRGKR